MGAVSAANFVVNSTADTDDTTLDGVCANASGQCTLRAAMQEAVFAGGVNSITFNIAPGSLVGNVAEIILTTGPLPLLTGANLQLTIDGATQPSALSAMVGTPTRVGTGPDGIVGTGDEFLLPSVAQPKVILIAPAGSTNWPGTATLGMVRINTVNTVTLNGLQFAATRGPGATFTATGGSGPTAIDIQNGTTVPTISTLTVTGSVFGFEGSTGADPGRGARLINITRVFDNDSRLNGAAVNFRGNYMAHLNFGGILLGGFDGPAGQVLPVVNVEQNFFDFAAYGVNANGNAIQLWGAMNSSVSRNLITNTQHEAAVHLQRMLNSRLDDNSILNSQPGANPGGCGVGITAQGGSNSFMRQNRLEDSNSSGIEISPYTTGGDGYPVSYRLSKNAITQSGSSSPCPAANAGRLGIDLLGAAFGVSPNDGTLTAFYGNQRMNYPVIKVSSYGAGSLNVQGFVGSATGQTVFGGASLEFFVAADDGNNNGEVILGDSLNVPHGEGYNFIGSCTAAANGSFNCTLPVPAVLQALVASGSVTSTATLCAGGCTTANSTGITSEFGASNGVLAAGSLMINKTVTTALPQAATFNFAVSCTHPTAGVIPIAPADSNPSIVMATGTTTGSVTVSPIVSGSTCSVAETAPAAIPNYTWGTTPGPNGNIVIASGATASTEFTNMLTGNPGTLTVSKTITGPAGFPAVTGSFPFTVACLTPTASYSGSVVVSAGNTGNTTLSMPAGSSACVISETLSSRPAAPAGYAWAAPTYTQPNAAPLAAAGTMTGAIVNPLTPLDPPFISKRARVIDGTTLEWTVTVINNALPNAGQTPVGFTVSDALPAGVAFVTGSLSCTPTGTPGQTSVATCGFNSGNTNLTVTGTLGYTPDTAQATASQRVDIVFRGTVAQGQMVVNTACTNVTGQTPSRCASNTAGSDALPVPALDARVLAVLTLLLASMGLVLTRGGAKSLLKGIRK